MNYSVCVPAVLSGKDVKSALKSIKSAGYDAFELWGWWDQDVDLYVEEKKKQNLSISAMCTKFISLTDPACREAYIEGLRQTAETCKKLGCKTVISQVGQELIGVPREQQHASIVEGFRECLPILRENDLTIVIEPLNTKVDHPGYYLWSSEETYQIVDEVGDEHVKVLFDLYHQYVMDDVDVEKIVKNMDKIGHFHMAGYPGRHEPMVDSEIDYPAILRAIRDTGYQGYVAMEYFPVRDAVEGIKQLREQLDNI